MSAPRPTPFPDLNAVLHEFGAGVQTVLGDRFVAAILLGSFAIGDFDVHSDVDFIVALEEDVPEKCLAELQAMHARICDLDSHWAKHLDGSYVPRRILRRHDPTRTQLLYLDNGSRELVRSEHCNTLVVRCIAREYGVTLAGTDAKSLIDPVPVDALRREVATTMHAWAREIRADPEAMNNRRYQPYAVLSYCRMLYTLHAGTIVSKPTSSSASPSSTTH
jgi:predicted nucleotidyltransferase